jgi:hypothetical protein
MRVRRDTVVLTRLSPILAMFCGALAAAAGVVAIREWPMPTEASVPCADLTLGGLVLWYLGGPAASLRIDAHRVTVVNPFTVTRLPRYRVLHAEGFFLTGGWLLLDDGTRVPLGLLSSGLIQGGGQTQRNAERVNAVLNQLAPGDVTGSIQVIRRRSSFALVVVAAAPAVVGFAVAVLAGGG